jgi:hypothetical protein
VAAPLPSHGRDDLNPRAGLETPILGAHPIDRH